MKRLKAVIVKEFQHILRDPRSLVIIFALPILQIFVLGYALSYDINHIETLVLDYSRSEPSARLLDRFAHNRIFKLREDRMEGERGIEAAEELLRRGAIHQYLLVPADFAQKLRENRTAEISAVIDGSDSNTANLVHQYNERILMEFAAEYGGGNRLFRIHTQTYFNPESRSTTFIIPGLVAVILIMISALLTSLSVAREKESGSIELLYISPLTSRQIILGKTVPYVLVALMEGIAVMLFARFWFGIPMRGNLAVLLIFSLVYLITGLSLGILISTVASSQKVAMIAALLITMLPSILLSGFIFPLDSLSPILRGISYIIPATYYLRIIRGNILQGATLQHLYKEGLVLLAFGFVLLNAAALRFNQKRRSGR